MTAWPRVLDRADDSAQNAAILANSGWIRRFVIELDFGDGGDSVVLEHHSISWLQVLDRDRVIAFQQEILAGLENESHFR